MSKLYRIIASGKTSPPVVAR